jgi:diaminopimelate epimerase
MIIPFTKAHGAKNDFLLTWVSDAPRERLAELATAICDRHTGVGADGWYLVAPPSGGAEPSIRLFNSDGSPAEVSGNGTRCAAAFLISAGYAGSDVTISTGAGLRKLQVVSREGKRFSIEMGMGAPRVEAAHQDYQLGGRSFDAAVVDVGNPQFVIFCESDFPPDWPQVGALIEGDRIFPNRTNVSFVRLVDEHTIDSRFFERGAGETMSSGTGATGAAAAARARGFVSNPVTVLTPAGPLYIEWRGGEAHLTGPAEIIARGEFYLP